MLVRVASSAARSLLRSRLTINEATGGDYQGMAANGDE
jgi:hypothetical protein